MKLGQKLKAIQFLGSKMSHNHTVGGKMASLMVDRIIKNIDKREENPKSFLEKR